jgi:lipopolysaccharide biosynthesis glycosyltransferase
MASDLTIVVATDQRAFRGCAVAVRSLLENCRACRSASVFVLHDGLSRSMKATLETSWNGLPCAAAAIFCHIDATRTADLRTSKVLTRMTYARLFFDEYVPDDVERVLYIDTDIVFGLDAGDLIRTDLGGATVGAVPNGNGDGDEDRHIRRLGMRGSRFFNAGVLLIDVRRWRELQIGKRVLEYCRMHPEQLFSLDQDALNVVLDLDWKELDESWNRWTSRAGSGETAVLHYTMTPKPWHVDYRGPFKDLFYGHLDRTALAGWRPRNPLGLVAPARRLWRRVPHWATVKRRAVKALHTVLGRE